MKSPESIFAFRTFGLYLAPNNFCIIRMVLCKSFVLRLSARLVAKQIFLTVQF